MSEQRIYIAQVLCPERHAILARCGEVEEKLLADPEALRIVIEAIQKVTWEDVEAATKGVPEAWKKFGIEGGINPWCGICFALLPSWTVNVGFTKWRTMEEAEPHLYGAASGAAAARNIAYGHQLFCARSCAFSSSLRTSCITAAMRNCSNSKWNSIAFPGRSKRCRAATRFASGAV